MSCEDEHHDHSHDHHGHSHGHEGHDHDHDHDHQDSSSTPWNLYHQIDFDAVTTLNEAVSGSGRAVLKKTRDQWVRSQDEDGVVLESDADEQLLMHVPFISSCKIHTLLIHSSDSPSCPNKVKLFRNRDDLDFGAVADLKPTQTIEVPRSNDVLEIPLNRALWNTTTSINLFVEDNHSGGEEDVTRIFLLGFRGDFMPLNWEPVSVLYEAAANPSDHKVIQGLVNTNSQNLGQ